MADNSLAPGESGQTELPADGKGGEQEAHEQQHEDGAHLAGRAQHRAPLSLPALLSLIVMPLDREKHARAEDENLEGNEDYGDPIQHFVFPGYFGVKACDVGVMLRALAILPKNNIHTSGQIVPGASVGP